MRRIFNIVREARDFAVEFVRENVRAGKPIRGAEVDDVSRGVITRAGFGNNSPIGPAIPLAKKRMAMALTSTISRRAIRGASFREIVFQSSREFTRRKVRRSIRN